MHEHTWAKLPRWIVLDGMLAKLNSSEIKILMTLIAYANQDGLVRASNRDLAELAGVSERTAERSTVSLKSKGVLEIGEQSRGRRASTYRIDTTRSPDTHDGTNTQPPSVAPTPMTGQGSVAPSSVTGQNTVVPTLVTGQACTDTHDGTGMSGLRAVAPTPVTGQRTHIGTRGEEEREREKESISLSDLSAPDLAIELLVELFPGYAVRANWSEGSFNQLRRQIDAQPLTTPWQARRCIEALAGATRKFPAPQPAEVFEAFRKIEDGNTKRERSVRAAFEHSPCEENIDAYRTILGVLDEQQRGVLFAKTRETVEKQGTGAHKLLWDQSVPGMHRHPFNDLQQDPESDQLASRGFRAWVIATHKHMEKSR
jgi:hypothetical protein